MIYNFLKEEVKTPVHFRGVPSIIEIKRMNIDTRDGKVEAAIRVLWFINWLNYQWSFKDTKIANKFNDRLYKQAISNAITYSKKTEIVVWSLFKMFLLLVQDINIGMSKNCKMEEFKKCLEADKDEYGVRDFNSFFTNHITEKDKKILAKDIEITWRRDVDWKTQTFTIELKDKSIYVISSRLDAMKVKNDDIINYLDNKELKDEIKYIYENIDDVYWRKRRWVYQDLFFATLFEQTYDKYNWLLEANKYLKEKLAKKV